MAEIIDLKPTYNNNGVENNDNAKVISLNKEEEEVIFDTQVHFNPQQGFHLKDKEGKHIYPLGGIFQNMVMQIMSFIYGK